MPKQASGGKRDAAERIADRYASGGDWGPKQRADIARDIRRAITAERQMAYGECLAKWHERTTQIAGETLANQILRAAVSADRRKRGGKRGGGK